ncbi:class I SAM-dependent methyltransferase [Actinospongicola halichondriae]|uniref:class I SAM-dependent methyltransferase n=1 Tax=Actinospongicola halichondriae TaxID=3236844 RepID=UPI003D4E4600
MSALDTWPFWAPSQEHAVEAALDLAGIGPGTRVCDLGCGDGQVLLAAARRGAVVSGIEADPDLVDEARQNLADAGIDADIRLGDLFDPDLELDADVFFAYLAPATLQRLLPTLQQHRHATLVTVDFDVPALTPTRRGNPARLYRMPGRRRPVPAPGWPTAGTLVATDPDCQSLSCLDLVHPGGPCDVRLSGEFDGIATVLGGADRLAEPAHLAVDLRWESLDVGTVVAGTVHVTGADDHALVVVITEEDDGMWELSPAAVRGIQRALTGPDPATTLAELLAATAV